MAGSLQTAVLGMRAYQEMLNVTGNNIANADTTAYKESRITFADIFSRTLRQGVAGDAGDVGGSNPIQIGQGVAVSSVDRNLSQGGFVSTERDFDVAIDGEGYFVVNDGTRDLYTRDGTFDVDANGYLVDASTGFLVQRIGTVGEEDGFQATGASSIQIPYKTELPGSPTDTISFKGNLSASDHNATTSKLKAHSAVYRLNAGGFADESTEFADIQQLSGFNDGDQISITGRTRDGTAVTDTFTYGAADDGTTLGDLLTSIETAFGGPTAVRTSIEEGSVVLEDRQAGYSMLDVNLQCSVAGLEDSMPQDFDYVDVGGAAAQTTNITVYDQQGQTHAVTGTFVRQAPDRNVWDLVINSISGATGVDDRRIAGIRFDDTGTFQGISMADGFGHTSADAGFENLDDDFGVSFPAIGSEQTLAVDFGRTGYHEGLTQVGGESSAGAIKQDGYGRGSLQSVSIDGSGVLRGTFSNGVTKDIAALRVAVFDNAQALESAGGNCFRSTNAVGATIYSQGMQGRAGRVRQNVLEDSNVDIANEFTRLIVAQRGFQVNSRTVHVTNGLFQNLTMLVS